MTHDARGDWADGEDGEDVGRSPSEDDRPSDGFSQREPVHRAGCSVAVAHMRSNDWLEDPTSSERDRRAYWAGTPECKVEIKLDEPDAGYALSRARRPQAGIGARRITRWNNATREFVLPRMGSLTSGAQCSRGCWVDPAGPGSSISRSGVSRAHVAGRALPHVPQKSDAEFA
jgi:hypothetical protein